MADNAFSTMSDDDLLKMVSKPKGPSDEALLAAVGQKPVAMSTGEDAARSFGSGLLSGTQSALESARAFTPTGMLENTIKDAAWLGHKLRPDLVGEMTPEMDDGLSYMTKKMMPGFTPVEPPKVVSDVKRAVNDAASYEPKTTTGRYAKTTGEFIPSAIPFAPKGSLMTKAASLLPNAVVPAISSEAAADAANYLGYGDYEPAARIAGSLVSPLVVEAGQRRIRSAISPTAGANPERLRNADVLESFNVPVTAGQRTGSQWLMGIEGSSPKMREIAERQPELYTAAVMKHGLGSNHPLATPEAMQEAEARIVGTLSSIAKSVDPVADREALKIFSDPVSSFMSNMSSSTQIVPNSVVGFGKRLLDSFKTGTPIPGSALSAMRTDFGRQASKTQDPQLKGVYSAAIDAIDSMVSKNLKAAGRDADWSALEKAREQYRNYLVVSPASLKANNGVLNPSDVMTPLRTQSKRALAKGERGDLGDLTMAARNVMSKLPASDRTKTNVGRVVSEALGGVGLGALGFLHSLPTAISLGSLGVAGPLIKGKYSDWKHDFLTSDVGQKYAANQKMSGVPEKKLSDWIKDMSRSAAVTASANGMISGGDERMGRKSGGRVQPHVTIGNRLVTAAERAKKMISKQTEPLLNAPDEQIVQALEVANRSI